MRVFISGGCKNGKSYLVQRLAKAQQADSLYYITDETGLVHCLDGESKKQAENRFITAYAHIVDKVLQSGAASAFVSCYGGTIACIMKFLQAGKKHFYEWQPEPGRGYTLTYVAERFHKYRPV